MVSAMPQPPWGAGGPTCGPRWLGILVAVFVTGANHRPHCVRKVGTVLAQCLVNLLWEELFSAEHTGHEEGEMGTESAHEDIRGNVFPDMALNKVGKVVV